MSETTSKLKARMRGCSNCGTYLIEEEPAIARAPSPRGGACALQKKIYAAVSSYSGVTHFEPDQRFFK